MLLCGLPWLQLQYQPLSSNRTSLWQGHQCCPCERHLRGMVSRHHWGPPGLLLLTHSFPLKMECGCLRTWRVIENGRTRIPLTLCNVPVLVHVQVWVHILGDPQSVQLRNATTTIHSFISTYLERIMTDALKDLEGTVIIRERTITNLRCADGIHA